MNRYTNTDDSSLLAVIKQRNAGWRDALAQLLERHQSGLIARCHYNLNNREDAEEASQETQLRVFRAIHGFRGDASFRTWLFSIADRQCHDLRARRQRHLLDDHLCALIEIHERERFQCHHDSELNTLLQGVLNQLSDGNREVLQLRFFADMSLEDMADTLQLGLSATKMRLYRALKQLGECLPRDIESYA